MSVDLPASSVLALLAGAGETPIRLEVSLTPSERVRELEQQVIALTSDLDTLRRQFDRTEYLYRCEVMINTQLVDYCREQGVHPPKRLFKVEDS